MVTENPNARIWSRLMKDVQFDTLNGMRARINELEAAEMVTPKSPEGDPIEEVRLVRSKAQRQFFGMVSPKYRLLQDFEIAVPLFDAVDELGLEPYGYIDQQPNGKSYASIFFDAPDYQRELRKGDTLAFGLRVYNGKNGKMGYGAEGMAKRLACTNGLIATDYLGAFSAIHLHNKEEGMIRFSHAIKNVLDGIPEFVTAANRAMKVRVDKHAAVELMVGAGMEYGAAQEVYAQMPELIPELRYDKLTGWSVHNALTAFGSHEARTDSGFEAISRSAIKVLDVDQHEDLITRGREKIAIMENRRTARAEARQAAKQEA